MADSSETISVIENVTEEVANATKAVSTPEGMGIAYGSIVIMALVPIFCGAFRSVKFQKEQKESGEKPETMSGKDAAMFPIYASCALFGLYVFFQLFSKEYINMLLTGYFFFLGVIALSYIASPAITKLIPASFPNQHYHLLLTEGKGSKKEDVLNYEFDRRELLTLAMCALVGVWYLLKRHWIANNMFGLSFAVYGVECLQLNRVSTGCILLGGLFIYDIFWVFGTDVMVTVAKSFEAPIKLVFPQDLLIKGLAADNFAMLGLGDIVIPGIFIALLLRFDMSRKNGSKIYFYTTFTAYVVGLVMTIVVMHYFKHPQPALLYLVPACVCTPLILAAIKGDLNALFSYEDSPEKPADEKKTAEKEAVSKKDK